MTNIHHLELFYYVAKHGGIAAAVRNMRYGIQQPAVSGQIARLEEALGAKLFNRRPFSLLAAGVELFEFVKPFFRQRREGRWQNPRRLPAIANCRAFDCATRLCSRIIAGCAPAFSDFPAPPSRGSASRRRETVASGRNRSCDHGDRWQAAFGDSLAAAARTPIGLASQHTIS